MAVDPTADPLATKQTLPDKQSQVQTQQGQVNTQALPSFYKTTVTVENRMTH